MAVAKHLIGNEQETNRQLVNYHTTFYTLLLTYPTLAFG